MSKQTAVEWLVSKLSITFQTMYSEEIEQAKAMEQEQIERAWMDAEINLPTEPSARAFARKYYEQTYGK